MMDYYIINHSAGLVGNSPMFWAKGGYTQWVDDAKKFLYADAEKLINSCRGSHDLVMVACFIVDNAAKRVVDIQDLPILEDCLLFYRIQEALDGVASGYVVYPGDPVLIDYDLCQVEFKPLEFDGLDSERICSLVFDRFKRVREGS